MILARARLDGRNGEVYHRYTVRMQSQEKIAEELDLSQQRVSQIIREVQDALDPVDKGKLISASLELISYVKNSAIELAEMAGAPVAVGKDGETQIDPETGEVVRDYSLRLNALKAALAADDVMAKRLGLDAATKTEVSGQVRYEIVGVDLTDLS